MSAGGRPLKGGLNKYVFIHQRWKPYCATTATKTPTLAVRVSSRLSRHTAVDVLPSLLTPPALASPVFGVVEARVLERRGKEVAETVPIPILAVRSLERLVVEWRAAGHAIACIVAWQMLLATWAPLRFDDCFHVDPASLRLSDSALYFTAQKTKRDQGRRGTKYVACNASLTQAEWLCEESKCLVTNAPDTL